MLACFTFQIHEFEASHRHVTILWQPGLGVTTVCTILRSVPRLGLPALWLAVRCTIVLDYPITAIAYLLDTISSNFYGRIDFTSPRLPSSHF